MAEDLPWDNDKPLSISQLLKQVIVIINLRHSCVKSRFY